MRLKQFVMAPILGLSLAIGASAQGSEDPLKRLTIAAYFSEACREQVAALEVPASPDVNTLFAVFERHLAATRRAPDALGNDCSAPAILLINLLRKHGIDAALAFVSTLRTTAAGKHEPSGEIERVVVYVPALDRYVDPSAPASGQDVLDAIALEKTERVILYGPSLTLGRGCLNTCMEAVTGNPRGVRVKTETIQSDHARGGMLMPPK